MPTRFILVILFLLFSFSRLHAQIESVKIGNQVWMKTNLDVDKFRNGDPIPEVRDAAAWEAAGEAKKPAWIYYNNDPANGAIYGKLYNWHAVVDARALCPTGWHAPSDTEWTVLTDHLGGNAGAGLKMKTASGWESYEGYSGNGNNESGFSGLPGGNRYGDGNCDGIGRGGDWWSSSEVDTSNALGLGLDYKTGDAGRYYYRKEAGSSVRCLRD